MKTFASVLSCLCRSALARGRNWIFLSTTFALPLQTPATTYRGDPDKDRPFPRVFFVKCEEDF